MADLRKHSSTSNRFRFLLKHSTTGQGLTGLDHSSSGLIISTVCDNEATATVYTVAAGNVETISTLGTFATPTTNKCRFKAVDGTNHPGLYEFQFADARFSVASAQRLVISVSGATNLLGADYEVQLIQADVYDAVRLGLTAIPNVAQGNAGQLPTADSTGKVVLQATQTGVTIPTVTTLSNAPLDSSGVTTLLSRLSALRAGYLDNLNVGGLVASSAEATFKKNVAYNNFPFVMFDTEGNPSTGLTVTAQRSIDGGAFAACTNSPSEVGNGGYKISFSAADLNGDSILVRMTASEAAPTLFTLTTES